MIRLLHKGLWSLLVVLSVVVLAGWWLFNTQAGLRMALKQLPVEFEADQVQGNLQDFALTSGKLMVADTRISLSKGRFVLNWWSLWNGKLEIELLQLQGLDLKLPMASLDNEPWQAWQGIQLPVDIVLTRGSVKDLMWSQGDGARTEVQRINTSLAIIANQLYLQEFDVQQAALQMSAHGQVDLSARARGKLDLRHEIQLKDTDNRLSGIGRIHGNWSGLQFEQKVSGKIPLITVNGSIDRPLSRQIGWQLQAEMAAGMRHEVNNQSIEISDTRVTMQGQLDPSLDLSQTGAQMTLQFRATLPEQEETFAVWRARLQARYERDSLIIEQAQFAADSSRSAVAAAIIAQRTDRATIAKDRIPGVKGKPLRRLPTILFSGKISSIQDFVRQFDSVADPGAHADAGNDDLSRSQRGRIDLRGSWRELDVAINNSPEYLATSGRFSALGSSREIELKLTADGERVSASGKRVKEAVLTAQAELTVAPSHITVEQLRVRAGESVAEIQGKVAKDLQLDWRFESSNLSQLSSYLPVSVPPLAGDMIASGKLRGTSKEPQVIAAVFVTTLQALEYQAEELDLSIDAVVAPTMQPMEVTLNTGRISRAGSVLIDKLEFNANGTGQQHRWQLSGRAARVDTLQVAGSGRLQADQWQGSINKLELGNQDIGIWRLEDPVAMLIGPEAQRVTNACLVNAAQRGCLTAVSEQDELTVDLDMQQIDGALLQPLLAAPEVRLSGLLNAELKLAADLTPSDDDRPAVVAEGKVDAQQLRLQWRDRSAENEQSADLSGDRQLQTLEFARFELSMTAAEEIDLVLEAESTEGDTMRANAMIKAPLLASDLAAAPLLATLSVDWRELARVPAPILAGTTIDGSVLGDFRLTGSINAPKLAGNARLTGASAAIRPLGLRLRDIDVALSTTDTSAFSVQGSLRSGDGELRIDGDISLDTNSSPVVAITLQGDDLTLLGTSTMSVVGDVKLQSRMDAEQLTLAGDIVIDAANLDLQLPESAVLASGDVVLMGQAQNPPVRSRQQLDLRVDLGQATRLRAQGIDTGLKGKLRVFQELDGIVRAEGQIQIVDGRYTAYAQELDIDNGRLIFDGGSIENPSLELTAQKELSDVTAGVRVSGRASAPVLDLYSSPALSDQDILSVLIFDKSLSQLGSRDGLTLLRIADSLSSDGPGRFARTTQSIQNALGLSEFELDMTSNQPGIRAGKQLSSRFYVGYGYNLLDATQALILRYKLNDNWSIKADVGADTGADLRYQIER